MGLFRGLSQILILWALGLALYDLVWEWFVNARFKIRTVREMLGEQGVKTLQGFLSKGAGDSLLHLPAPVAIALLAAAVYLIYRLLFLVSGESKSSRL